MSRRRHLRLGLREDRGSVLVIFAFWLPLLVLVTALVVDVGNRFEHDKHLQLQADAGALAGGSVLNFPCSDPTIETETRNYAGTIHNAQIGGTSPANIHPVLNSTNYWDQGGTDFSDGGTPCTTKFVDVKITESNLGWFFGLGLGSFLPAIHAHARVRLEEANAVKGLLPVSVNQPDPTLAQVTFIDESNGQTIATAAMTKMNPQPSPSNLVWWESSSMSVDFAQGGVPRSRVGVRIALGGGNSVTCGQLFVECYDLGSSNGMVFARGWTSSGTGAYNAPLVREVEFLPGSCPPSEEYFFTLNSGTCTLGVRARIDFGPTATNLQAAVSGPGCSGGNPAGCQLTPVGGGWWQTTAPDLLDIQAESGPQSISINTRAQNNGSGPFRSATISNVHRTFAATEDRSGPIKAARIYEGGTYPHNTFQTNGVPSSHNLVVRIGIRSLQLAAPGDPPVRLRVIGSQNQTVDCEPPGFGPINKTNIRDELHYGCDPWYAKNVGGWPTSGDPPLTCPAYNQLWNLPNSETDPWRCVKTQTGGAVGQVGQGMRERVHFGQNGCVSPNFWPSYDPLTDPRIITIFVTPIGSFSGSGNDIFPVLGLADFYVTGFGGTGPTPDNCVGNEAPGAAPSDTAPTGWIVGHFIKYTVQNSGGGTGQQCNLTALDPCVAVLVD